ncbi:---NA--- [Lecanosticta acicola]|uniref:---NA n=1 Tax=Lecanosticta acicola TaxID=111012 RepID=A0AAI9EEE1_9PEZI|nr:---NA--- [Lecanosticta acicola]
MADTYTLLFENHCPAVHRHAVKDICQRVDNAFQQRNVELSPPGNDLSTPGNDQSAQLLELLVQAYEVILPAVARSDLQQLAQSGLQGLISAMPIPPEDSNHGPSTPAPDRTSSKKREAPQDPPPPPKKKHKAIEEPILVETRRRSRVACDACRKRKAKCQSPDGPGECQACIYYGTTCNQPWKDLANPTLPLYSMSAAGFNHVDAPFFSQNFAPPPDMPVFHPMMAMHSGFQMGMPMNPSLPFGMSDGRMYQFNAGTTSSASPRQGQKSGYPNAVTSQMPAQNEPFMPSQRSYDNANLAPFQDQSSAYPNGVSNQVPFQNGYSLPQPQSYEFGAFANGNEPTALTAKAVSNSSVLCHRNAGLDRTVSQDRGESRNSHLLPAPHVDGTGRPSTAENTTTMHAGDQHSAAEAHKEGDAPGRLVIDLTESPISTVDHEHGPVSPNNTTQYAGNQTHTSIAPPITSKHQSDHIEPPAWTDFIAAGSVDPSPVVAPEDHFELAMSSGISDEVPPGLDTSSTMPHSSSITISDIDHFAGIGHPNDSGSGFGSGTSAALAENAMISLAFPEPVWPPPAMSSNDEGGGNLPAGGQPHLTAPWTIDDTDIVLGQVELLETTDDEFSDDEEDEDEAEEGGEPSDSLLATAGSTAVENLHEDEAVEQTKSNGYDDGGEWPFDDLFDVGDKPNGFDVTEWPFDDLFDVGNAAS